MWVVPLAWAAADSARRRRVHRVGGDPLDLRSVAELDAAQGPGPDAGAAVVIDESDRHLTEAAHAVIVDGEAGLSPPLGRRADLQALYPCPHHR